VDIKNIYFSSAPNYTTSEPLFAAFMLIILRWLEIGNT